MWVLIMFSHEKNIRQIQPEGYWHSSPQTCAGHENQGELEQPSRTPGDEVGAVTERSVAPWMGFLKGKRKKWKKPSELQIRSLV